MKRFEQKCGVCVLLPVSACVGVWVERAGLVHRGMFNALKGLVSGGGGATATAPAGGAGRGQVVQRSSGAVDYDAINKSLDKALFTPSYDAVGVLFVRI